MERVESGIRRVAVGLGGKLHLKRRTFGIRQTEQVSMFQNSVVDRGLDCIPLFGLERLGASSFSNPKLAVSAVSNTITDSIIVQILTTSSNTVASN